MSRSEPRRSDATVGNPRGSLPARLAAAALLAALLAGAALGGGVPLQVQETEDLRLITYTSLHGYIVPHLEKCFANSYDFYKLFFGFHSKEKISILLEDFGDYGHGGADSVPRNHVSVGLAPFTTTYETMPSNERMNWLMNHELVHVVVCDKPAGHDLLFRKLFLGKVAPRPETPESMLWTFLTNPRRYSPRWYHEGIAVFMETWTSGGLGRALGGYDEMVFRTLCLEDRRIFDPVGLESEGTAIDFQVGVNSYLYGTRFMTWLASEYGPDKLLAWVNRTPGSRAYFSSQFRQVYGFSLTEGWSRWVEAEHRWQAANLERIRRFPVTRGESLTREPLGSVSRTWLSADGKTAYAGVRSLGRMAELAAIHLDTGEVQHLRDVKGSALYYVCSLALSPDGRKLFYTTDNNKWRDLHAYDLETGKDAMLIRDFRGGDLVFDRTDESLWGIRNAEGVNVFVRLQKPYNAWVDLAALPYGQVLSDIDLSPDGASLTGALSDASGAMKVVAFDKEALRKGRAEHRVVHDFGFNTPCNFVFSPDGKYLYGSTYETGVSNVVRLDFATGEAEVLSNADTGLFRPLPLPGGGLLAYRYSSDGFTPVRLSGQPLQDVEAIAYLGQEVVKKFPEVKGWKLGSPTDKDIGGRITRTGGYGTMRNLSWLSLYPIVQGYKGTAAGGFRTELQDHIGLSSLGFDVSVSPASGGDRKECLHLGFDLRHWMWKVSGGYNTADFYDLFGPTKTSRKGYWGKVEHQTNLLFDTPRTLDFDWDVGFYGGAEEFYQDIPVTHPDFLIGHAALTYSHLDKSLGAVDDEKGYLLKAETRSVVAGDSYFQAVYGTFHWGFLTPLRNSPVWLRFAGGKTFGDSADSFGNFFFGSFGNNWVDHGDISQYRKNNRFPGVDINSIGAPAYLRAMAEWNLPPHRFERAGRPWLYCNWVRLSLFGAALVTGGGGWGPGEKWFDAGAQLDFRIVLFSHLNSTLSVGFAGARNTDGRKSTEFMISLKLL